MCGGGVLDEVARSRAGQLDVNSLPVVSVVIVNFNGGPLLGEGVWSVLSSSVPVEVFVVDNGSTDGSLLPMCRLAGIDKRLQIIENRANLGLACAANVALTRAQGEYILLLNPDVVIKPGTLERMVEMIAAYPEVGMAGCLLRNPDGTEQAGCRRSVPTPWRTLVRVLHLDRLFPNHPRFRNFVLNQHPLPEKPVLLEAISGAFMLIRRRALQDVGLLDEKYFLHCEDLDWSMRFRQAGWNILFVPELDAVHYQGTCSKDRPVFVLWHKHKGMIRFYRKFFQHQYPWPLMPLVVVAVWTRFLLLAVMTILMPQESRESTANIQERFAIVKTAAQEKSVTSPSGAGPDADSMEVVPETEVASIDEENLVG